MDAKHILQMIAQSLIICSSPLPYDKMKIVMICLSSFRQPNRRLNLMHEKKKKLSFIDRVRSPYENSHASTRERPSSFL